MYTTLGYVVNDCEILCPECAAKELGWLNKREIVALARTHYTRGKGWTFARAVEYALEDCRDLVDERGDPVDKLSSGGEYFSRDYCNACSRDLEVPVSCTKLHPENAGLEHCECADCEKNPMVATGAWAYLNFRGEMRAIATAADTEGPHTYRRKGRPYVTHMADGVVYGLRERLNQLNGKGFNVLDLATRERYTFCWTAWEQLDAEEEIA